MAEIVNLNRFRKAKAKSETEEQAARNRVAFGRSRAERDKERAERDRAKAELDGKTLKD